MSGAALPALLWVAGLVVDASGAPVPGAVVSLEIAGVRTAEVETGADGRFTFAAGDPGTALVRASAPGFAEARARVAPGSEGARSILIVLQPAPVSETVAVTASRGATRLLGPESSSVLTSAELLDTAAGAVDDALRNTPGFSLFRRSSSRVANPTTQGVTLRGVSGSGASRTLVLADGVPLNDPFGSWVYWNRIPQAAIDRVEIVRGTAGDLYGAEALGGVIQILTFGPERSRLRAIFDAASRGTARASVFGGGKAGRLAATAGGEWLATDGTFVVSRAERGKVDVPAQSDYRTGFATAGYEAGSWRAQARASIYTEDRGNGTPLQVNATDWRQYSAEAAGSGAGGAWLVRASGGSQDYDQSFSAVSADRARERLTSAQHTPSTFASLGGQRAWIRASHVFLLGAEARRTRADARETRYSAAGEPSGPFSAGGTEKAGAVFGRASLNVAGRVTVVLGARGDLWRSLPLGAAPARHSAGFFSPRAAVSWRPRPDIALRAAFARTYRTPTLNELYRDFRVGNVVTNPNPLLEPERLSSLEGGVLVTRARAAGRLTGFWNRLDAAVANVTLRATPSLITRERQNAGRVRASGLEAELELRPFPGLTLSALAALTSSRLIEAPKLPALVGKRVPQVPRQQLGVGVSYADPRILTFSAQVRRVGAQFDDDLNQLKLRGFTLVDASAGRRVRRGLHAFLAVENLLDAEYDVGRTPVRTVGWPRTVRGGVRLFLP